MKRSGSIGWDHPATARYYEEFCERHERYGRANRELVRHARLKGGQRVLDLGAGTGRTAEAILERAGKSVEITCVELAAAMRRVGMRRMGRGKVRWLGEWPAEVGGFDRIVCGAGIWQMMPLDKTFYQLARLLKEGGWLCFDIPSLYLGEADLSGGGRDSLLLELARLLAGGSFHAAPRRSASGRMVGAEDIDRMLVAAGLEPHRWRFRLRLSYECYRDWLKIPVMTNRLMPKLTARQRARRIDEAYRQVDARSWRWECWTVWAARKGRLGKREG